MDILTFLSQALGITLVDIDNAMYTTGRISALTERRRLALGLSLALEFVGRLLLLWLFLVLTNETEPLFTIFGFEFTLESIALLGAGGYLLISNSRELTAFLQHDKQQEATLETTQSFSSLMIEMGVVLTIMSIDTVLVITTLTTAIGLALSLLLFSALVRLFFVERLVHFIELYPAVRVFILILLIAIGVELIIQGFGLDVEVLFNILVIIAILVYITYQRRMASLRAQ
jgi:predicted tellurium resistance membrane protein TerC